MQIRIISENEVYGEFLTYNVNQYGFGGVIERISFINDSKEDLLKETVLKVEKCLDSKETKVILETSSQDLEGNIVKEKLSDYLVNVKLEMRYSKANEWIRIPLGLTEG